jgi:hypothetical protein
VTNNVPNHCANEAALHSTHASQLVNLGSFQARPENVKFQLMKLLSSDNLKKLCCQTQQNNNQINFNKPSLII